MQLNTFCATCYSPLGEDSACRLCEVAPPQPPAGPARRTRAPSALIVIGMWLVLLPGLVIAFEALMIPTDHRIRTSIIVGLIFWAYGAVLHKVTSRYLEAKRRQKEASSDTAF